MKSKSLAVLSVLALAGSAMGGLVTTQTEANLAGAKAQDGVLGTNEYGSGNSQSYTGSGSGFGGWVGGSTVYMAADSTSLFIGWQSTGSNDNLFALQFNNTGNGVVSSAQKNDGNDGGRRASTFNSFNGDVNYGISTSYSLVFGSFGAVLFGLTANPTSGINFLQFDGNSYNANGGTGFREIAIPWASIGGFNANGYVDWFGYGISDSGYVSSEALPTPGSFSGAVDGGGNPGFGDGSTLNYADYHRFAVPAPAAAALLGLGGLAASRRRRA